MFSPAAAIFVKCFTKTQQSEPFLQEEKKCLILEESGGKKTVFEKQTFSVER